MTPFEADTDLPEQRLYTVQELCRVLNVKKARGYMIIRMGEIGHLKIGRSIRIPKEEVENFIRRKRKQTGC